jgi:hypothetical protein
VSTLNIKNAPGFSENSSTPFGGTVGIDYETPRDVIVGVAFSASDQRLHFSTGGHCTQIDAAASFSIAHQFGPIWGNASGTYGLV